MTFQKRFGKVDRVPTRCFFGPMDIGEELSVPMEDGKTIQIKCNACTEADSSGRRQLFFEVNGDPIAMYVTDKKSMVGKIVRFKASDHPGSVGAPMPGQVIKLRVSEGTLVANTKYQIPNTKLSLIWLFIEGTLVAKNTPLVVLSAMKMETIVTAPITGLVKNLTIKEGDNMAAGDLLLDIVPTESIRMP